MGGDGERTGDYERYIPIGGDTRQPNVVDRVSNRFYAILDGPTTWFRKTIVEPNQQQYNWYHRQFRRVPTIDECFTDDQVCFYEANSQFKRDRLVDSEIVSILRMRMDDCVREEYPDHATNCFKLKDDYEKAAENWFTKYGDLGAFFDVKMAYMKQKHRLLWERRHGPVGCGMKSSDMGA